MSDAVMPEHPFSVVALDTARHDRCRFDSGVLALDRYLREQVSQDIRRRVAACFVAQDKDGRIAGYYTLSTASVPLLDLPEPARRKLPRYESVPAIRMGRLAVDTAYQGQGLGAALLMNALKRAATLEIASALFFVDAKDERAASFYKKYGFIPLTDERMRLFLPLATVAAVLSNAVCA